VWHWGQQFNGKVIRRTDRLLSAKLVPTFAYRECHVVSVTNPYGRILGFLDRTRCVTGDLKRQSPWTAAQIVKFPILSSRYPLSYDILQSVVLCNLNYHLHFLPSPWNFRIISIFLFFKHYMFRHNWPSSVVHLVEETAVPLSRC
jgi:hypothetical protein